MRGFIAWRRDSAASYVISYAAQIVNFRLVECGAEMRHSERAPRGGIKKVFEK